MSPFGSQAQPLIPSARIVPITGKAALAHIAEHHRHLPKLRGALFAVAVEQAARIIGVGTAGNPPRVWQGTGRFVISRVAVLADLPAVFDRHGEAHAHPACTMLYGALCQAGKALGYSEAWTYTLPHEPGTSLRAAGFVDMGLTRGGEWDRPSRRRSEAVCALPKRRWCRVLRDHPTGGGRMTRLVISGFDLEDGADPRVTLSQDNPYRPLEPVDDAPDGKPDAHRFTGPSPFHHATGVVQP